MSLCGHYLLRVVELIPKLDEFVYVRCFYEIRAPNAWQSARRIQRFKVENSSKVFGVESSRVEDFNSSLPL